MYKILLLLTAVASFAAPVAHAQTRSNPKFSSIADATPAFNTSIINLPPPTGDSMSNRMLNALDSMIPIVTPIPLGAGTLNSSNNLFATPGPNLSGAF
jgi:hypothetical protein